MSSQAATAPFAPDVFHKTSAIVISRMTPSDIPAVMDIEKTAFPRPWPEKAYRYELTENPNAYFVVAHTAATASIVQTSPIEKLIGLFRATPAVQPIQRFVANIVGFAGMWMYVDEAHIATIATHPAWRGLGIGELILRNLLREAQRRNAVSATLEVRLSNTIAQNLYRKYGFAEVGRRKAYYQDNREDALLMTVADFDTLAYRDRLDAMERANKEMG